MLNMKKALPFLFLLTSVTVFSQTATEVYLFDLNLLKTGAITVDVALAPDGSFAEAPACPTLCVSCEDRLDLIMEPEAAKGLGDQPGDRETLGKYLKAMNLRAWD